MNYSVIIHDTILYCNGDLNWHVWIALYCIVYVAYVVFPMCVVFFYWQVSCPPVARQNHGHTKWYKYVRTCVCMYVCVYIYVCMYACMYVYVCMYVCMLCTLCMHACLPNNTTNICAICSKNQAVNICCMTMHTKMVWMWEKVVSLQAIKHEEQAEV